MTKKISKIFIVILFVLTGIGFLVCTSDHGLAPLPGRLDVQLIFLNDEIPENTEGVYLFVAPEFPPHAINELHLSPNSIPLDNDTVWTTMYLPYGYYEAMGLWWFNEETESNLADVFSINLDFSNPNYLYQFELTDETPVHQAKFIADLNRVDRDANLEGTIHFNGPFPENTLATAIAALVREPEESIEYFIYLQSLDFSVNSNPTQFSLPIKSRTKIRYLAVFWLSDRSGLDDFKTIGFYEDPDNPGEPGVLTAQKDETISGIEIYADWSKINEE